MWNLIKLKRDSILYVTLQEHLVFVALAFPVDETRAAKPDALAGYRSKGLQM